MATWTDFQTAIQFVAGLNVALFGVPELRAPGIASERQQEADLLRFANARGEYAAAVTYQERFSNQWEPLFSGYRFAVFCCLAAAVIETVVLFRASGSRATEPANCEHAWLLIGLGLLPALILLVLNLRSRAFKAGSLKLRNEFTDLLQNAMNGGRAGAGASATPPPDGTQN